MGKPVAVIPRRGDEFYQHVAKFVSEYPNRDYRRALAVASEVPLTTAESWIRIARARGLLSPFKDPNSDDYICPRCGFPRAGHRKAPAKITDPRDRCIWLLRARVQHLEAKLEEVHDHDHRRMP